MVWVKGGPTYAPHSRSRSTSRAGKSFYCNVQMMRPPPAPTLLLIAAGAVFGCSKGDTSASSTTSGSVTAATSSPPSSTGVTPVRGTLTSITDSMLTVSSATGEVRIAIASPLAVYSRVPAKLSQVKESSFVGVTSVAQPDGSQRATEIHIFPENLRGTGEGSYLMAQPSGSAGGSRNTMTNGTVTGSRMTNGTAAAPRMTNGTISGQQSGTLTVQYQGGTQTITIPPNVPVTAIASTRSKLTPGSNVVALTTKQPDGTLKASAVILAGAPGGTK